MMIFALAFALSGQAATLPLPAGSSSAPVQTAQATTDERSSGTATEERRAGRPLVCRNETVLGSRFPVRRCRPANLTPQERALAADQLRRQQTLTMNGD